MLRARSPSDLCLLTSDERAQAAAGGVTLHLPPPPAIALKGDERRLRQCVVNLLANAIKFAPGGTVTVSAAVTGPSGIEIRIADTGCGIPADQLERVFEPFHQVENELSRATNGTGLGLPLSRKLAERHGGTLDLESVVGGGTTRDPRPAGPRRRARWYLASLGSHRLIH